MTILAPVMLVLITWILFVLVKNLMTKLTILLSATFCLSLNYMEIFKVFWPCGLMLILICTGLIVIFAYIASLHSKSIMSEISFSFIMSMILLSGVLLSSYISFLEYMILEVKTIDLKMDFISVSIKTSVILIIMLLFLVVLFVRLVYSKGGGFRKKF